MSNQDPNGRFRDRSYNQQLQQQNNQPGAANQQQQYNQRRSIDNNNRQSFNNNHNNHPSLNNNSNTDSYNNHNNNNNNAHLNFDLQPLNLPNQSTKSHIELETDQKILDARIESIRRTKLLPSYESYLLTVAKDLRNPSQKHSNHPVTPPFTYKLSKRRYKGLFDQWCGLLHGWDNGNQGYNSLDEMKTTRIQRHLGSTTTTTTNSGSVVSNDGYNNDHDYGDYGQGQYDNDDKDLQQHHIDDGNDGGDAADDEEDEALAVALRLAASIE